MSSESDMGSLQERLGAPFDETEIKFKPGVVSGNRALALPYVDARVIQDRLDEVFGLVGWQDDYDPLPDGTVVCRLKVRVSDEWIMKCDVGSPSEQPDEGDRRKASFSDALKRAAVKFGIGRYLYRQEPQWVDFDPQKKKFARQPKMPVHHAKGARTKQSVLPRDGAELKVRLEAFDRALADNGLCKPGDLMKHVVRWGTTAGHDADVTTWGEPAISEAVEEARSYQRVKKAEKQPKKAG